ncbi:MAG: hypothetical protein AB1480_01605 [Nitrospirota bacterium]
MEDINQVYKELLDREFDSLERERRKQYEHLVNELIQQGMVREGIHIEKALELEIHSMRRFIDYALSQFKRMMNSSEANIEILGKTFQDGINLFFGRSLQRMIGITINVRSPIREDYPAERLEKLKSKAVEELESVKSYSRTTDL